MSMQSCLTSAFVPLSGESCSTKAVQWQSQNAALRVGTANFVIDSQSSSRDRAFSSVSGEEKGKEREREEDKGGRNFPGNATSCTTTFLNLSSLPFGSKSAMLVWKWKEAAGMRKRTLAKAEWSFARPRCDDKEGKSCCLPPHFLLYAQKITYWVSCGFSRKQVRAERVFAFVTWSNFTGRGESRCTANFSLLWHKVPLLFRDAR